jgi:hypothetical protein
MDNIQSNLKKAKNVILMSDENWIVRNEENDVINFIYSKE